MMPNQNHLGHENLRRVYFNLILLPKASLEAGLRGLRVYLWQSSHMSVTSNRSKPDLAT